MNRPEEPGPIRNRPLVHRTHKVLRVGWRRILLLCASAIIIGAFVNATIVRFRAERLSARTDARALKRATQLEPGSAEYQVKLAEYLMFVDANPTAAAKHLEVATSLEPTSAQIWLDLARVYYNLGEDDKEKVALEHALREAPTTPSVAWEVGLFRVVHGDVDSALPQLRGVLMSGVIDAGPVLSLAWRVTKNVNRMLDEVVPRDPEHYSMFLNLLVTENQPEAAATVWKRLLALSAPFPLQSAFGYIDYLIDHRNAPAAYRVWCEAVRANPPFHSYLPTDNLIVNGSFTEPILNGGFDWRYTNRSGVQLSLDSNEVRSRTAAMSVTYENSSSDDAGIMQWIVVQPNTDYEFSGFVKSTDLITVAGPRFQLSDGYDGTSFVLTDEISGTTGWSERRSQFHTGPNTTLIGLRVVRQAQGAVANGKLWFSDLRLVKTH